MGKDFKERKMNIPEPSSLDGFEGGKLPYSLVGGESFPLQEWLIKSYSKSALTSEIKQIFNYRQSRARRVIENAFGILVSRWRIFRQPIEASPEKVEKFTLVAIALHNYLRQTDTAFYTPSGFIDSEDSPGKIKEGSWRGVFQHEGAHAMNVIPKIHNSRTKNSVLTIRDNLAKCLVTEEGQVPWQWDYVRRSGKTG